VPCTLCPVQVRYDSWCVSPRFLSSAPRGNVMRNASRPPDLTRCKEAQPGGLQYQSISQRTGTASPRATVLTVPRQRSPSFVRSVTTLARTRQEYLPASCPEVLGTRRRPTLTLRCRVSRGRTEFRFTGPLEPDIEGAPMPLFCRPRRYRIGGRLPEAGRRVPGSGISGCPAGESHGMITS
jgi:hypothetical protein